MTRGSPSWLTGREARSSQASALAVSGSGAPRAPRRVEGMPVQGGAQYLSRRPAAGVPGQQRRDGGQRVGQAGPRMRRQVRPFHLRVRHRVPVPGHRLRLRRGPRLRLPGRRGERQALAGRADQLGAVTVGQRPGHERPRPVAARDPPADLERLPAGPAPDREHPHIERTHGESPWSDGNLTIPVPSQEEHPRLHVPLPSSQARPSPSARPRPEAAQRSRPGTIPAASLWPVH